MPLIESIINLNHTSVSFNGSARSIAGESEVVGLARPLRTHSISFEPRENLNDSKRTDRTTSEYEPTSIRKSLNILKKKAHTHLEF